MRIRNLRRHGDEKPPLRMTAMIDIVFLLLVFFIMTFRIVSPEGHFDVRMPQTTDGPPVEPLPPIKVRMLANADGSLHSARIGVHALDPRDPMSDLRRWIVDLVGENTGPGSVADMAEVELDCDRNLDYGHVIAAITAVSGHVTEEGHVVKLVEKIKFSPPAANSSSSALPPTKAYRSTVPTAFR